MKLKPCPFCGNNNVDGIEHDKSPIGFEVVCYDCQCGTRLGEKEDCIKAWNTRTEKE